MRKTSLFFIFAFAFLHSPAEARAAGKAVCDAYVEAAVKAAKDVRDRGCGGRNPNDPSDGRLDLDHPQWNLKEEEHRRWCMGSSEETVQQEIENRNRQLGQCERCAIYSDGAVESAKKMRTLTCGFDDKHPSWSLDRSDHLKWCMASEGISAQNEDTVRGGGLTYCELCQDYGKLAMDQAAENAKLKCGFKGPRWESTREGHVNWCIHETRRGYQGKPGIGDDPEPAHTDDEANARAGAIARCKQTMSAQQGLRKGGPGAAPYTAVPRKKEKADTKPVQAARKPADQSAETSRQNVPQAGGSSAMDRLGGGPSGTGGGSGAASVAKPRSGASAAEPASAGTGGGGGVAPPATGINRNAIGGGGAPERIR